jgi:hypothetical protein
MFFRFGIQHSNILSIYYIGNMKTELLEKCGFTNTVFYLIENVLRIFIGSKEKLKLQAFHIFCVDYSLNSTDTY